MVNKLIPVLLVLAIACSKSSSNEAKPATSAKPAPAKAEGGDGTAMALEEGAKSGKPPTQDLPPIGDKLELQAAVAAEYQKRMHLLAANAKLECDQLATAVTKLQTDDRPSQQRIAAYASAHSDELAAITGSVAKDYAEHTKDAAPVIARCKDNKVFATAIAVPPWQVP
jgi:hypothetical protein